MKTSELSGVALDQAVAKCEELAWALYDERLNRGDDPGARPSEHLRDHEYGPAFTPSTSWAQGGPIIDREPFGLFEFEDGEWSACINTRTLLCSSRQTGPTLLVAAMRSYVESKLGEEVQPKPGD